MESMSARTLAPFKVAPAKKRLPFRGMLAIVAVSQNMANTERLEQKLKQWVEAGVIDAESAQRIRSFERSSFEDSPHGRTPGARGLRWPVVLAVSFGALMIAAGVLLFVAAHWDE